MINDKITLKEVLLPLFLLSFIVVVFLGFQTWVLVSDRNALQQSRVQQDIPLLQVEKVKTQLNALAVGTMKLAQKGNKNAENILDQLKKAGITVVDQPSAAKGAPANAKSAVPLAKAPAQP